MKQFLKYQIEIDGTEDSNLTEEVVKKLNEDYESRSGIYEYGECSIGVNESNNRVAILGVITAQTQSECKAKYKLLKEEIKSLFKVKLHEVFKATGSRFY